MRKLYNSGEGWIGRTNGAGVEYTPSARKDNHAVMFPERLYTSDA